MTPPRVYDPSQFERRYVDSDDALQEVAEILLRSDAIGVDLEMGQRVRRKPGGIQEWRHILGLLQIANDTTSVVIDPLRVRSLLPLKEVMAGPARKVLLGGGQDVALLEREAIPVRNIVDVGEAAYALFGRREDGMAALSKRIFDITLDKSVRRMDWLARPLHRALIDYAFQDAELTLLIYRWFQENEPELLELHQRAELDPELPRGAPSWLAEAMVRTATNPAEILEAHRIDPQKEQDRIAADIVSAMDALSQAPRRVNRLIRIASELGLKQILSEIVPLADSRSSLLRASAARAIGRLATPEEGTSVLTRLASDPLEDVRKSAEAGLRDLKRHKEKPGKGAADAEEESTPTLNEETVAQLQELLKQLQPEQEARPETPHA